MRIFLCGYPSHVGGACTEAWHTIKMLRRHGVNITCIPTWQAHPEFRQRLEEIGVQTWQEKPANKPGQLVNVPGLEGSIVLAFCNRHFLTQATDFRKLGCRLVWVNCMTYLFNEEIKHYRQHGLFDRYVWQSHFQRDLLEPRLQDFGYDKRNGFLIRGAFEIAEFSFTPRERTNGEPFTIGRISRADADKFSSNLWKIWRGVRDRANVPVKFRVLGWADNVKRKLGKPQERGIDCICLPPNAEPATVFYSKIDLLWQWNGGARENWPRSGLEAMAVGVPLIVQDQWGWREMVEHGITGFRFRHDLDAINCAVRLTQDEPLRQRIIHAARKIVSEEHANEERIWKGWETLLASLS